MHITAPLRVANNVSLGLDYIDADTDCGNFIELRIPVPPPPGDLGSPRFVEVSLFREDLIELIQRTMPRAGEEGL
jgi:hypothetical protein